jgi:hypothetical protein
LRCAGPRWLWIVYPKICLRRIPTNPNKPNNILVEGSGVVTGTLVVASNPVSSVLVLITCTAKPEMFDAEHVLVQTISNVSEDTASLATGPSNE